MGFNMYSLNYLCEKDFNILSHCVNLFLRSSNATDLLVLIELCLIYLHHYFLWYMSFVVLIKY